MKREIERARIELYELVEEFNLTDPIVLLKSKELDELLNQYDELLLKEKSSLK